MPQIGRRPGIAFRTVHHSLRTGLNSYPNSGGLSGISVTMSRGALRRNAEVGVIDTVLNMLFRCSHRHLTRPLTRVGETGGREGASYVVCLDCGKQFAYDLSEMRIGKVIDQSHDASVVAEK